MPKTAVGLFENPGLVDGVVREIEALGFPRKEVRTLTEPATFEVTGVMSFPRLDFEVDLVRELTRIGAAKAESQAYVEGLRRGGALVFATGSDEKVEAAADIMNRHGAVEIEETSGPRTAVTRVVRESMTPMRDSPVLAGRIREPGGGAAFSCGNARPDWILRLTSAWYWKCDYTLISIRPNHDDSSRDEEFPSMDLPGNTLTRMLASQ